MVSVGILWLFVNNCRAAEATTAVTTATEGPVVKLFEPLFASKYTLYERVALISNVFIGLAGLFYALLLVKQVKEADREPIRCSR
jgi:ABC-type enterobactin transport system permease subunit